MARPLVLKKCLMAFDNDFHPVANNFLISKEEWQIVGGCVSKPVSDVNENMGLLAFYNKSTPVF